MKIRSIIVAIIAVAAIAVVGCQKDPLVDTTEITTKQVTSITGWSAVSGGEVTSDGTPTISKRGVCWSTSPEPTMNDYTVTHHNGGLGKFSVTMDGLSENTTYYVRAFAWNSTGAIYGEEYSFTTPYKPILSTLEVEEVTSVSAVCGGNITDDGNAVISQRGLCWSTHENPTIDDSTTMVDSVGTGTFKSEMTKLTPGTLYYVRAYATNVAGTGYGDVQQFTTQNIPVLKATEFANVTQETVVCSGSILDNAGADVTEQGFCWSTTPQPTIENEKITATAENGLGDFSITISGLQWGTTYYVRSYATNSVGTAYGDETSFTTWTLPTITTNATTNVTDVSVDCGGTIVSDGGTDITEKGLCWNNSANPTIENEKLILNGENFSGTIIGLTDGVVYYVRAYATNAVGTMYGEERAFTTLTVPIVETYNAENVSYTTATAKAKVMADGGTTVTERGFCYSTSNTNPTLSDNKITVGNGTGNFNYSFTSLTDNTSYYIRSYATNSIGTAYGSTINFTTTEITVPTVAATTATNVSYTSVTLGGNVTNENGATVTERGVCYGTSTNPTINDNKVTAENGIGTFTVSVANLADGVTFYARAYAINERGITYGEAVSFTTTKITAPTVTTTATSNVSYTTVTLGGNVTNANGATVTERGICWGTSANPTISNSKKAVGTGAGAFTTNITGLNDGVTYYVRAYATNSIGTAYGEEMTFTTTKITTPTVTTTSASNVTYTTATLGGNVTAENGATVTERGVCYSTSTNPTISNSKKIVGSGTGSFSIKLTELNKNVTYYVRAYAINSKGTSYGSVVSFTTTIVGAIQGKFSVSETKQIYFSQGNLQYQVSTNTWRFAEHQWDYVGTQKPYNSNGEPGGTVSGSDNNEVSLTYNGWIDLFGWGASGYDIKPYFFKNYHQFGYICIESIAGTNYDWGVYNKINNGGNQINLWRTLTYNEWNYVIRIRENASRKYGFAMVNEVPGFVLLPDEWTQPSTVSFYSGESGNGTINKGYSRNIYSVSDWEKMEANGAVFFPAAGYRLSSRTAQNIGVGQYWSSTGYDDCHSLVGLYFSNSGLYRDPIGYYNGYDSFARVDGCDSGLSVRLVRNVE